MKILTFGINDREIQNYKMKYLPQSIPQYCEYRKRGDKPFRIIVNPQDMFIWRKRVWILFHKMVPVFIFNILNRQSLSVYQDENGEDWFHFGNSINITDSKLDPKSANVLDYLMQPAFWAGLRQQMEISKMAMMIFMIAGAGCWAMFQTILGMIL